MPVLNEISKKRLEMANKDWFPIIDQIIKYFDILICNSYRGKEEQDKAVAEGRSKTPWPNSKHNSMPSMALDIMPLPLNWDNKESIIYLAGNVTGVSRVLFSQGKIKHIVRWGGDWKMDNMATKNSFNDLDHFELVEVK